MERIWIVNDVKDTAVGSLTLKEPVNINNLWFWVCECVCGKTVRRREDTLRNNTTTSCGCQHPRRNKGHTNATWKGCGDIDGQYFSHLKNMARKRKLPFLVSIDYIWSLFEKQNRACALTGLPINFASHKDKQRGVEQTASLDRIDSSKGYTCDNIQWVHKDVNRMKNEYPLDRFLEICRLVIALRP